jgi:hypothetical protein
MDSTFRLLKNQSTMMILRPFWYRSWIYGWLGWLGHILPSDSSVMLWLEKRRVQPTYPYESEVLAYLNLLLESPLLSDHLNPHTLVQGFPLTKLILIFSACDLRYVNEESNPERRKYLQQKALAALEKRPPPLHPDAEKMEEMRIRIHPSYIKDLMTREERAAFANVDKNELL